MIRIDKRLFVVFDTLFVYFSFGEVRVLCCVVGSPQKPEATCSEYSI